MNNCASELEVECLNGEQILSLTFQQTAKLQTGSNLKHLQITKIKAVRMIDIALDGVENCMKRRNLWFIPAFRAISYVFKSILSQGY